MYTLLRARDLNLGAANRHPFGVNTTPFTPRRCLNSAPKPKTRAERIHSISRVLRFQHIRNAPVSRINWSPKSPDFKFVPVTQRQETLDSTSITQNLSTTHF